jgi:hypothetical protein
MIFYGEIKQMSNDIPGLTKAITINSTEEYRLYITVGFYANHDPRRVEITLANQPLLNSFIKIIGRLISRLMKHKIPLDEICKDLVFHRDDSAGFTDVESVRNCMSIGDMVGKMLPVIADEYKTKQKEQV